MRRILLLFVMLCIGTCLSAKSFLSSHKQDDPLKVTITWSYSSCDSSNIHFTGSVENLSDGDSVISFIYSFGDGEADTTLHSTTNHTYGQATYIATLTVKTLKGYTAIGWQNIYIPYVAQWSSEIASQILNCSDSLLLTMHTSGPVRYYAWSTGDTTASIIVRKSQVVACIVKDACQVNRDTAYVNALVEPAYTATITYDKYRDTLYASWASAAVSYIWYKDGVMQNQNTTFHYTSGKGSGLYEVVVTFNNGCTFTGSYNLIDNVHTGATLTYQTTSCDSAQFLLLGNVENLPDGDSIISKLFDYGDGTTGTSENQFHRYEPGTYYPTFTAVTSSGKTYAATIKLVAFEFLPVSVSLSLHTGKVADSIVVTPRYRDRSFYTFTWDRDQVALPDTGWYIIPTVTGNYVVSAHPKYGCTEYAAIDYVADTSNPKLHIEFAPYICDSTGWFVYGKVDEIAKGDSVVNMIFDYGDGTTSTYEFGHIYASAGTYNVSFSVETALGHTATVTQQLVVPEFLPTTVSISLHSGTQDTIFAKPDYRDPSFFTFKWSKDGVGLSDTNWFIFPSGSGTYTVNITSKFGCAQSKSIQYTLPASTTVTPPTENGGRLDLSADFGNTTFTTDNEFTIELTVKGAGGRTLLDGEVITLGTIKTTDPSSLSVAIPDSLACASNYSVRIISSSPLDTTLWSSAFTITNQPPQPVITQLGDSLFTTSSYDLQWYKDDVAISGATNVAIRARANGAYKVAALNGTGCTSLSEARSVIITAVTNVSLGSNTVSAYPNPSAGPVYLKFGYPLTEKVQVKVYNIQGLVVYTTTTIQQQQLLELSTQPKGFYLVEVTGYGTRKVLTIILQ